jgi:hypothetical protein
MVLAKDDSGELVGLFWIDSWASKKSIEDINLSFTEHFMAEESNHHLPHYFDENMQNELREKSLDPDEDLEIEDIMLINRISDQKRAQKVIEQLKSAKIPVYPEKDHMVCDGCSKKIRIYTPGGTLSISYWTHPPDEWTDLDHIYNSVWELVMDEKDEEE